MLVLSVQAIPRNLITDDWMSVVLLLILILVASAKSIYAFSFRRFSKVLFAYNYLFEEKIEEGSAFNYILFIANALILSLGLYFINAHYEVFEGSSLVSFFKLFLLYVVFTVGKYLIEKILGIVFAFEDMVDHYVNYKITLKNFLALILFPFLILLAYSGLNSPMFIMGLFWFFILLNLVYLSVFFEKTRIINKVNWYYIILYLCTFEIAPYFIVYKVIV